MNIFVISSTPSECAQMLDDKRLQKMILESAQMLSTAIIQRGGEAIYKPTHRNHPCTVWTGATGGNYLWHLNLFSAMSVEYQGRRGRTHKSFHDCFQLLNEQSNLLPDGPLQPFPNCSMFKELPDTFEAYKATMRTKWLNDKIPPRWTNSNPPAWKSP